MWVNLFKFADYSVLSRLLLSPFGDFFFFFNSFIIVFDFRISLWIFFIISVSLLIFSGEILLSYFKLLDFWGVLWTKANLKYFILSSVSGFLKDSLLTAFFFCVCYNFLFLCVSYLLFWKEDLLNNIIWQLWASTSLPCLEFDFALVVCLMMYVDCFSEICTLRHMQPLKFLLS